MGMVCVLATPWHTTYPSHTVTVFDSVYPLLSRLVLLQLNLALLDHRSHALVANWLTDLPQFSQCLANIYCKLSTYYVITKLNFIYDEGGCPTTMDGGVGFMYVLKVYACTDHVSH